MKEVMLPIERMLTLNENETIEGKKNSSPKEAVVSRARSRARRGGSAGTQRHILGPLDVQD